MKIHINLFILFFGAGLALFSESAAACTCAREQTALVNPWVAPNEAILIQPIIHFRPYTHHEFYITSQKTGKNVPFTISKHGGNRIQWYVLVHPMGKWEPNDLLSVYWREWTDMTEGNYYRCNKPEFSHLVRKKSSDEEKVQRQCLTSENVWKVRVSSQADREAPSVKLASLRDDNVGGDISLQSCFMRAGVSSEITAVSEPGSGSRVVLFAAYLYKKGNHKNMSKTPIRFPPTTQEKYDGVLDWDRPNGLISFAVDDTRRKVKQSIGQISLGVLGCGQTPKTLAPVGEEVCLIVIPMDLAGNVGKPVTTGCVTMPKRDFIDSLRPEEKEFILN